MINSNLQKKIEKYKLLQQKLTNKYNEKMRIINKILNAINSKSGLKECDDFETIVFKKYLEVENVSHVAKYVNDLGYRVKTNTNIGERKYNGTDITEILISDVNIDEELKEVVKYLQDKNHKAILRIWG